MSIESKPTILIVEDVNSSIDVLNHILKSEYTVYIAKTGEAALEKASRFHPDLILLDIILPDITGFIVLTELKKADATRDIPIIFITGLNNVQNEEKGLALGAVDYITKPFHNTIVLARVKLHLQILKYTRTIERMGLTDTLTDLPNRRAFDKQIQIEWGRSIRDKNPLGLLLIDIDRFHDYNSEQGFPQGDLLLQILARTVSKNLKRPADFIARYVGDSFAILLPNTDSNGTRLIAENIRSAIEEMVIPSADGRKMNKVCASVGGVWKQPTSGDLVDPFVLEAEDRLKQAKSEGRNRVCF